VSTPRPSVAAFRHAARALGALLAGADEVLSSALLPLDAPLPLADASPFDALPAVDLAREAEERTHAADSAPRHVPPAPEPLRRIQPQRAKTAADTDAQRMDADGARRDAVAAFRRARRTLAAMPRGVEGLLAAPSALSVLAPELPSVAATAFAGISEDALPTPRTPSAADEERRGGRASSRDLSSPAPTLRPPAPRSVPRATAAWSAADPAETARTAVPGSREAASSPAPPVHRLARRDGVRGAASERTNPHDHGTSTDAARSSSAPAAPADAIASGPAAVDGNRVGRGDGAGFERVPSPASTQAAPWDVDAFTRRVMAERREDDAEAPRARHVPESTAGSLAEQADALGAGLRRVDELARRVMAAGARTSAARAESIHPLRQANAAPEPRIHAPAPPADPFAAWGAAARIPSTEAHPAGPVPEAASGNPFAALLAPSAPVTAQSPAAVPDLAAHALTHARTPHSALRTPAHPGTDWHDDAAAAALDPAALADLVNDALVEQARLHGVDLS
jgi:hypothetical protein